MKEGQKQDQQKNKNNMNVYKNKNNQRKITIPKKRVFFSVLEVTPRMIISNS